jgi:hypothetical protein
VTTDLPDLTERGRLRDLGLKFALQASPLTDPLKVMVALDEDALAFRIPRIGRYGGLRTALALDYSQAFDTPTTLINVSAAPTSFLSPILDTRGWHAAIVHVTYQGISTPATPAQISVLALDLALPNRYTFYTPLNASANQDVFIVPMAAPSHIVSFQDQTPAAAAPLKIDLYRLPPGLPITPQIRRITLSAGTTYQSGVSLSLSYINPLSPMLHVNVQVISASGTNPTLRLAASHFDALINPEIWSTPTLNAVSALYSGILDTGGGVRLNAILEGTSPQVETVATLTAFPR